MARITWRTVARLKRGWADALDEIARLKADVDLFRKRSGDLTDVEVALSHYAVKGSAYEMARQLGDDQRATARKLNEAEAERDALRATLAAVREKLEHEPDIQPDCDCHVCRLNRGLLALLDRTAPEEGK